MKLTPLNVNYSPLSPCLEGRRGVQLMVEKASAVFSLAVYNYTKNKQTKL